MAAAPRHIPGSASGRTDAAVVEMDDTVFTGICGNVLSGLGEMDRALAQLLLCKDTLFDLRAIPTNVVLHIAMAVSGVYRSCMDVRAPVAELVRLIRLYQQNWDRKSEALSDILEEHRRARSELAVALAQLEQRAANDHRMHALRMEHKWMRLFVKLNNGQRQGARWKHLIGGFGHSLRENTILPGVVSDPDDVSDDEHMLPCKEKRTKVTTKAARNANVLALEEEINRLQGQLQLMRDRLALAMEPKPSSSRGIQTDGLPPVPKASPHTPAATLDALREALGKLGMAAPLLCLRVQHAAGLRGYVPGDLECVFSVSGRGAEAPKDVARTVTAPRLDRERNCAVFHEDLVLHEFGETDTITISLQTGPGQVWAKGMLPMTALLRCANAVTAQSDGTGDDEYNIVAAVCSTVEANLRTTPEYAEFCVDANWGGPTEAPIALQLYLVAGVVPQGSLYTPAPLPATVDDSDKHDEPPVAKPVPSRRRSKYVWYHYIMRLIFLFLSYC